MSDLDRVGTQIDQDEVNKINDMLQRTTSSEEALFKGNNIKVSNKQTQRVDFDTDLTEEEKLDALAWVRERRLKSLDKKAGNIVKGTKRRNWLLSVVISLITFMIYVCFQIVAILLYLILHGVTVRKLMEIFKDYDEKTSYGWVSLSYGIGRSKSNKAIKENQQYSYKRKEYRSANWFDGIVFTIITIAIICFILWAAHGIDLLGSVKGFVTGSVGVMAVLITGVVNGLFRFDILLMKGNKKIKDNSGSQMEQSKIKADTYKADETTNIMSMTVADINPAEKIAYLKHIGKLTKEVENTFEE